MPRRFLVTLSLASAALLICGCGSKISEANYYRVQYGMTEEDVEDLLGPAHEQSPLSATVAATAPDAATRPVGRVQKSWTRDGLTLHVVFEDGKVVGRSAEGMPAERPRQNVNKTPA